MADSDQKPPRALSADNSNPYTNELGLVELSKNTQGLLRSFIAHPDTTQEERFGLIRVLVIATNPLQTTSTAELPADGPARVGSV
jgi:hypothetical protein